MMKIVKKIIKITLGLILAFVILSLKSDVANAATRTWDGGGGADTNWSTCANWDGPDICPVAGDDVVFNATSTNNSTVDAGFGGSIGTISINAGYTGTITLARSLNTTTIASSFVQSAGHFNASNQTLDIDGSLTLASGADFTASSGTTFVGAAMTINSGSTFSNNSGTMTFDGTNGGSLSCNNNTFNLVTFNHTAGTKTVTSTCSLPLGSNPVLGTANTVTGVTLTGGTLSGSGTISTGFLTLNAGAVLSGFTGIVGGGVITVSGATLNLGSYTTVDLNSNLTISSGSFTAPSGTMTLAGSLTISGTPTFNANGGTITFDGTAGTLACNNVTFNFVTFNHTAAGSSKTINSDCSLPLGNNPVVPQALLMAGTISGTGTISFTGTNTSTLNNAAVMSGFSGIVVAGGFTIAGATLDLSNYNPVTFTVFTLNSGATFTAPTGVMTVNNNFTHTAGTFNHNNGTVDLGNTSSGRTISGSTTFYNLRKVLTTSATTSLIFTAGTTQTILGTLTLTASNGPLQLRSSSAGTQWNIDARGARSLYNLNVQDSNNINSSAMVPNNSVDAGNNINWVFGGTSISFALDYPGGNSHITNPHPTYRWSKAQVTNNSAITKYELYLDNGATNDFYIDNISPSVSGNGTQNNLNYILYDDGSYLNLTTKDPYGALINAGKKNWRMVAHDSAGNTREESLDFYFDQSGVIASPTAAPIPLSTTPFPISTFKPMPTSSPTPTESPISFPGALMATPSVASILGILNSIAKIINEIAPVVVPVALIALLPIASLILVIENALSSGSNLSGQLISRSLQATGLLPKEPLQGVVFDASTDKPIAFAVLTATSIHDPWKTRETFVTDSSGTYYGANMIPGTYKMTVAHQDYTFPSQIARPTGLSAKDYYKGEEFKVQSQEKIELLNIPMDARELVNKPAFSIRNFLTIINKISKALFIPILILSLLFFISTPNLLNGLLLFVYLIIFWSKVLSIFSFPRIKGKIDSPNSIIEVTKKDGTPLEITQTDSHGNYKLYTKEKDFVLRIL